MGSTPPKTREVTRDPAADPRMVQRIPWCSARARMSTHEGHNLGFLKLASQALTVKQPIPKSQIMTLLSIFDKQEVTGKALLIYKGKLSMQARNRIRRDYSISLCQRGKA